MVRNRELVFNPSYIADVLWFDPDPFERTAPVPPNRTDAMSVFLHELGHALAYNGWRDHFDGSLPGNYMSIFDYWVLVKPSMFYFTGPAVVDRWDAVPDLTYGNMHHWGNPGAVASIQSADLQQQERPQCEREHHRLLPNMIAPPPRRTCELACCSGPDVPPSRLESPVAGGSWTLIDELMNGVVFYHGTRYYISQLDMAMMLDVGLTLRPYSADINGDGTVDGLDLLILLSQWGECPWLMPCPADLNRDFTVDGLDLLILLSNWG